ncbi:hypothetical protein L1887_51346 [Cichorium endivia]|nr:hypothetical protein L1887_51346 [Cichorium endivia]
MGRWMGVPPSRRSVTTRLLLERGTTNNRVGAALALGDRLEARQVRRGDSQHVSLLRLVAPDLHGAHRRVVDQHVADLEARAEPSIVHELGQRVAQTARTDIVDALDGVTLSHLALDHARSIAEGGAGVDDLLAATLHLGIVTLDRGKVERGARRAAARHGRGRTTAEADEHTGPAEHDDRGVRGDLVLERVLGAHVAEAAGEHDGLVVASHLVLAVVGGNALGPGAPEAAEARPPKLVVEGGAAERAVDHNVVGARDVRGLAKVLLPGAGGRRRRGEGCWS